MRLRTLAVIFSLLCILLCVPCRSFASSIPYGSAAASDDVELNELQAQLLYSSGSSPSFGMAPAGVDSIGHVHSTAHEAGHATASANAHPHTHTVIPQAAANTFLTTSSEEVDLESVFHAAAPIVAETVSLEAVAASNVKPAASQPTPASVPSAASYHTSAREMQTEAYQYPTNDFGAFDSVIESADPFAEAARDAFHIPSPFDSQLSEREMALYATTASGASAVCENSITPLCANAGVCTDNSTLPLGYSCACTLGYSGYNCTIDNWACHQNATLCHNGGSCIQNATVPSSFTCGCASGFTGSFCDTPACTASSCLNNGTCIQNATNYTCQCASGWTGNDCSTKVSVCATTHPCNNGGSCADNSTSPNGYTCTCNAAVWSGTNCEQAVQCLPNPCKYGGNCTGSLATGFACACPSGYSGTVCENASSACTNTSCPNGGTCNPFPGGFNCTCTAGWDPATNCNRPIDNCPGNACKNNATCVSNSVGYSCNCTKAFAGQFCDTKAVACLSLNCLNGGYCVEPAVAGDPGTCVCPGKGPNQMLFTGTTCQNVADNCSPNPCANNGTCTNQAALGTYQCTCADGFAQYNCTTCKQGRFNPSNGCQNSTTPTPQVVNARVTDDASWIVVTFDSYITRFGTASSTSAAVSCSAVLASTTLSKLGSNTTCLWGTATTSPIAKSMKRLGVDPPIVVDTTQTNQFIINIAFSVGISIQLGDPITLLPNIIQSANGESLFLKAPSGLSTKVLAPINVPVPTALIVVPAVFPVCDAVTFADGGSVGGAGRKLIYSWALANTPAAQLTQDQVKNVNDIFNGTKSNTSVTVDGFYFPPSRSFTISLTVSNWLGGSATASAVGTKAQYVNPPILTVPQTVFQIDATSPFNVVASYSLATCKNVAIQLFQWSLASTTATANGLKLPDLSQASLSSLNMSLVANTLLSAQNYTFTLTGTSSIFDQTSTSQLSITIMVNPKVPPSLSRAYLDSSSRGLWIEFDAATNRANMNGASPCESLIDKSFTSLFTYRNAGFNNDTKWNFACLWKTDTLLYINWDLPSKFLDPTLPSAAQLIPPGIVVGLNITLKAKALKSSDGSSDWVPPSSVIILRPLQPLSPTPKVSGPSMISSCDSFTLDAIRSASNDGRVVSSYQWSLASSTPALASTNPLQAMLQSSNTAATFKVGQHVLPAGTYTFSVAVGNAYSLSASGTITVQIVDAAIPLISITDQPTNISTAFDAAIPYTISAARGCGALGTVSLTAVLTTASSNLASTWYGPIGRVQKVLNGLNTFAAQTFRPDSVYTLTYTATDDINTLTSSFVVTVNVIPVPAPKISGMFITNSGSGVNLQFDVPTNGTGSNIDCTKIWTNATYAMLAGRGTPKCSWSTASLLVTLAGRDSTFKIGTPMAIRSSFILTTKNELSAPIDWSSLAASTGSTASARRLLSDVGRNTLSDTGYSAFEENARRRAAIATRLHRFAVEDTSSDGGISLQAPDEPAEPTAVISAPDQISSCNDIVLNGANSLGGAARPFQAIVWFVKPDPLNQITQAEYDKFNDYFLSFAGIVATIPAGYLPPRRNYTFGLMVKNWLGFQSIGYTYVFISDESVPLVYFHDASDRTLTVSDPLVISTALIRSPCDTGNDAISYHWEVIQSPENFTIPLYTRFLTDFYLHPFSLLSNAQYQFRVTALAFGVTSGTTATVTVTTKPPPVVAMFKNRNGTVSANDLVPLPSSLFPDNTPGLIIDASASFDPESRLRSKPSLNFIPSTPAFPGGGNVTYTFSCLWKVRGSSCFDTAPAHDDPLSPYWYIPIELLEDTATSGPDDTPDSYVFSVSVQYGPTTVRPAAESKVAIDFTYNSIPAGLSIRPLGSEFQLDHGIVSLQAVLPAGDSYQIQWSVGADNTFNISDPSNLLTSLNSSNLVLAPYALPPGGDLDFTITIWSLTRPWLNSTSASITVRMADVPSSGYCEITPDGGVSVVDSFQAACYQWADNEVNVPLQYEFYLLELDVDTKKEISRHILGLSQGGSLIPLTNMPAGLPEFDYLQSVRAIITNGFGAQSAYDFQVQVFPPPPEYATAALAFDANSTVSSEFGEAIARGDHTSFAGTLHSIVALASTANYSAAQLADLNSRLLAQLDAFHSGQANESRLLSTTDGVESQTSLLSLICGNSSTLTDDLADQCLDLAGRHISSVQSFTRVDTTDDMNNHMLSTIGEVFRTTQYGASCGNVSWTNATAADLAATMQPLPNCTLTSPTGSNEFPDANGFPYNTEWWNYLYFSEQSLFLNATGDALKPVRFALVIEANRRLTRAQSTVNDMKDYLLAMAVANTKQHVAGQSAARSANRNGFLQIVSQKHDGNSLNGSVLSNYGLTASTFTNNSAQFSVTQVNCNITDPLTGIITVGVCNVNSSLSGQSITPADSVTAAYAPGTTLTVSAPSLGLQDANGNSIVPAGRVLSTVFTTLDYNPFGNSVNGTKGNSSVAPTVSQVLSFSIVDITDYSNDTAMQDGSTIMNNGGGAASPPTGVSVSNLAEPFIFIIPHTEGVNTTAAGTNCEWWDATAQQWSSVGCIKHNYTALYTTCACLHLTDFRISLGSPDSLLHPSINLLSVSDFSHFTWANIQNHPTVFLTLLIVFGVYFVVLPFIHHMDQRRFFEVWNDEANRELHRHEVYLETGILMTDAELYELTMREREAEVKKALLKGNLNLNSHWNDGQSPKPYSDIDGKSANQIIMERNLRGSALGDVINAASVEKMTPYQRALHEQQRLAEQRKAEQVAANVAAAITSQPFKAHRLNEDPAINANFVDPLDAVEAEERNRAKMTPYERAIYEQKKLAAFQKLSPTTGNDQAPGKSEAFTHSPDEASNADFVDASEAVANDEAGQIQQTLRNRGSAIPPPPNHPPNVPAPSDGFVQVMPAPTPRPMLRGGASSMVFSPPGTVRTHNRTVSYAGTNNSLPMGSPNSTGRKIQTIEDPHKMIGNIRKKGKSQKLSEMSIEEELKAYNNRPFLQRWYWRVRHNFRYNHIYVSIMYRKKNDVLTGVEKITVVLCYILGAMLVNAAFYQNKQNNVFAYVSVAVISSAVIIPAKMLLREVFGFSGAVFEEKRNKFRKQYRKIIAAKIAADLTNDNLSVEAMDKKLGLQNPSEEERAARLKRQEEYCELLMNDTAVAWDKAEYEDEEKRSIDEMSDAELLAMKADVAEAEQAQRTGKVGQSPEELAPTAPRNLRELDQVNELERDIAQDMMRQDAAARERRERDAKDPLNSIFQTPEQAVAEQAERALEDKEHEQRLAAKRKEKTKKKPFRCPACCKTAMMVIAFFWCLATSILMLVYGIKFDLSAEEGGVGQDTDPVARSYLWLISCAISMSQDILINEPAILCAKAAATIVLGNAFAAFVRWIIKLTTGQ